MFAKLFRSSSKVQEFLDQPEMSRARALFQRLGAEVESAATDLELSISAPERPQSHEELKRALPHAVGQLLASRFLGALSRTDTKIWDNSEQTTVRLAAAHAASTIAAHGAASALSEVYADLSREVIDEGTATLFALHQSLYGQSWTKKFLAISTQMTRQLIESKDPGAEKIREAIVAVGVAEVLPFAKGDPADAQQVQNADRVLGVLLDGLNYPSGRSSD